MNFYFYFEGCKNIHEKMSNDLIERFSWAIPSVGVALSTEQTKQIFPTYPQG